MSKIDLPENVVDFINFHTTSFGKIKLVLRQGKYTIEINDQSISEKLLNDDIIKTAICDIHVSEEENEVDKYIVQPRAVHQPENIENNLFNDQFDPFFDDWPTEDNADQWESNLLEENELEIMEGQEDIEYNEQTELDKEINIQRENFLKTIEKTGDNNDDAITQAFEIAKGNIESVRKRCSELKYPILEEYDFRQDSINLSIDIDLKSSTKLRPYQ